MEANINMFNKLHNNKKKLDDYDKAFSNLNNETIHYQYLTYQYLKVIYLYLDSDNEFSEKDIRNFAEIEAGLNVSEEVDTKIREYRFSNKKDDIIDEFIELKNLIPEDNRDKILQLLISDILSTFDEEKINSWKDDEILLKLAEKANISKDKVSLIVISQKTNHDIIDDKLTGDEYKERMKKIKEISSSLGVSSVTSVSTLALTGAVVSITEFGFSDVSLGLAILGTGGLGLAVLGASAAGLAAYKGMERWSKSNNPQESMKIEILQNKIKKLVGSQSLIIKDINYLSDAMIQATYRKKELSKRLTDSEQQLSGMEEQIDQLLQTIKEFSSAGTKICNEHRERERQLINDKN